MSFEHDDKILSILKLLFLFRIHGMTTEVCSSGQHKRINKVMGEIGLQETNGCPGVISEDLCHIIDAIGEGYALASQELLGKLFF